MISENINARKKDLLESIEYVLKNYSCSILENGNAISIQFSNDKVIGIAVEANGYCIYNVSDEWAEKTTYLCEKEEDGTWYYNLGSIDECIGEIKRIAESNAKTTFKSIINDGTLLSVFRSIEDEYIELTFSNTNAKNQEEKRAVYIYPKNASGKGKVVFEIWKLKKKGEYDLYIKKKYMTDDEYAESKCQRPRRTTGTRGVITRVFESDQDLIDFMIPRLNMATNK